MNCFGRFLYCLLHSIFPDSNKPSIEKKLVQKVDPTLLKSQTLPNDGELFGPMKGVAVVCFKDDITEAFGES